MFTFLQKHWKLFLLSLLVILGLVLQKLDIIDFLKLLTTIRGYTDYKWLVVALILYQVILFMFALPGSTALWLVAPVYTPVTATIILTTGGTLGGIAAYLFSRHLGHEWQTRIRQHHLFHTLEKRGDLLSLFGLRVLPGFPHSVINYTAGILHLPPLQFTLATFFGLAIKNMIYCTVIYRAFSLGKNNMTLTLIDVIPLLVLTLIIGVIRLGVWYRTNRSTH